VNASALKECLFDFWLPFTEPAMPQEKTQEEIDGEAYQKFYEAQHNFTYHDAWHAALAWERSRKK
jgi:hypothetical protein